VAAFISPESCLWQLSNRLKEEYELLVSLSNFEHHLDSFHTVSKAPMAALHQKCSISKYFTSFTRIVARNHSVVVFEYWAYAPTYFSYARPAAGAI
jgi:hypothetical protein